MEVVLALKSWLGTYYRQLPDNASNTQLALIKTAQIFMLSFDVLVLHY